MHAFHVRLRDEVLVIGGLLALISTLCASTKYVRKGRSVKSFFVLNCILSRIGGITI